MINGMTLRALIYFSGQGGACHGYRLAGFNEVKAVDINPQPYYVSPDDFIQADALSHLAQMIRTGEIREFDFVGGSPPCQRWTKAWKIQAREHPDLIAPFRELCIASGLPYIIENVEGAPLIDPVMLCGASFPGLNTYRHRLFESNLSLTVPEHPDHEYYTIKMGRPLTDGDWYHAVGNFSNVPYVRRNMGVPWMTREGIRECVPPAYTEYLGRQVLSVLSPA